MSDRKLIDWTKPIRSVVYHREATRLGRREHPASVYKTCVEFLSSNGQWYVEWVDDYGKSSGCELRFENVPQKRVAWMNVYEDGFNVHTSRHLADQHCTKARIACVRVEFEAGDGLPG